MKRFYKVLGIIFLYIIALGCSKQEPKNIFIGIDLSNSNITSLESKLTTVVESVYEYHPESNLIIYAFGDNVYKVYDGKIPLKPRELINNITKIIKSNIKFSFKDGTNLFKLIEVVDQSKFSEILIVTDGYFELTTDQEIINSHEILQNNNLIFNVNIYGCSIQNRDKMYKVFGKFKIKFMDL